MIEFLTFYVLSVVFSFSSIIFMGWFNGEDLKVETMAKILVFSLIPCFNIVVVCIFAYQLLWKTIELKINWNKIVLKGRRK